MENKLGTTSKTKIGKRAAAALALSLILTGGLLAPPSWANTSTNPTIVFDGNSLAATSPKDEVTPRLDIDSLGVASAGPLSRVATTSRAGYTFGGWSLTRGGAAITDVITTVTTSDTFRIIYAVWNTTVRYNLNGADSGALTNFKTQDVYRFGRTLDLPTVGTAVKAGYNFSGWVTSPMSSTSVTKYLAGNADLGNLTLFAAWTKGLSFDGNGATTGTVPAPLTYVSGGERLKLPSFSESSLRRTGYNLAGWSTWAGGDLIRNPRSYVPLAGQNTLYAIWKIQGTAANANIAFAPGKSKLRASQKLVLDDIATSVGFGTGVSVSVSSLRARGTLKSLGRARNIAVVEYLRSLGINATVTRSNSVATSGTTRTAQNNRVTMQASWTNPAS